MYWLQDLLTPISDARFHFGRKLTTTDISVLHQVINRDDYDDKNNDDDDDNYNDDDAPQVRSAGHHRAGRHCSEAEEVGVTMCQCW